jgi:hypothetical protein
MTTWKGRCPWQRGEMEFSRRESTTAQHRGILCLDATLNSKEPQPTVEVAAEADEELPQLAVVQPAARVAASQHCQPLKKDSTGRLQPCKMPVVDSSANRSE